MVWAREQAFVAELADCLEKASTGRLERLAGIAIDDDKQCYKHVCALLERSYRKAVGDRSRINVLYLTSEIMRLSRKQAGAKDKYGERLLPLSSVMVSDLSASPDFKGKVQKLVRLWRQEGVYNPAQSNTLERLLQGEPLPQHLQLSTSQSQLHLFGYGGPNNSLSMSEVSAQAVHSSMETPVGARSSAGFGAPQRHPQDQHMTSSASAPDLYDPFTADSSFTDQHSQAPPPPPPSSTSANGLKPGPHPPSSTQHNAPPTWQQQQQQSSQHAESNNPNSHQPPASVWGGGPPGSGSMGQLVHDPSLALRIPGQQQHPPHPNHAGPQAYPHPTAPGYPYNGPGDMQQQGGRGGREGGLPGRGGRGDMGQGFPGRQPAQRWPGWTDNARPQGYQHGPENGGGGPGVGGIGMGPQGPFVHPGGGPGFFGQGRFPPHPQHNQQHWGGGGPAWQQFGGPPQQFQGPSLAAANFSSSHPRHQLPPGLDINVPPPHVPLGPGVPPLISPPAPPPQPPATAYNSGIPGLQPAPPPHPPSLPHQHQGYYNRNASTAGPYGGPQRRTSASGFNSQWHQQQQQISPNTPVTPALTRPPPGGIRPPPLSIPASDTAAATSTAVSPVDLSVTPAAAVPQLRSPTTSASRPRTGSPTPGAEQPGSAAALVEPRRKKSRWELSAQSQPSEGVPDAGSAAAESAAGESQHLEGDMQATSEFATAAVVTEAAAPQHPQQLLLDIIDATMRADRERQALLAAQPAAADDQAPAATFALHRSSTPPEAAPHTADAQVATETAAVTSPLHTSPIQPAVVAGPTIAIASPQATPPLSTVQDTHLSSPVIAPAPADDPVSAASQQDPVTAPEAVTAPDPVTAPASTVSCSVSHQTATNIVGPLSPADPGSRLQGQQQLCPLVSLKTQQLLDIALGLHVESGEQGQHRLEFPGTDEQQPAVSHHQQATANHQKTEGIEQGHADARVTKHEPARLESQQQQQQSEKAPGEHIESNNQQQLTSNQQHHIATAPEMASLDSKVVSEPGAAPTSGAQQQQQQQHAIGSLTPTQGPHPLVLSSGTPPTQLSSMQPSGVYGNGCSLPSVPEAAANHAVGLTGVASDSEMQGLTEKNVKLEQQQQPMTPAKAQGITAEPSGGGTHSHAFSDASATKAAAFEDLSGDGGGEGGMMMFDDFMLPDIGSGRDHVPDVIEDLILEEAWLLE